MSFKYNGWGDKYQKTSSPVIQNLLFEIRFEQGNILDIKITDEDSKRYEIPSNLPGLKNLYNDVLVPEDSQYEEENLYSVDY